MLKDPMNLHRSLSHQSLIRRLLLFFGALSQSRFAFELYSQSLKAKVAGLDQQQPPLFHQPRLAAPTFSFLEREGKSAALPPLRHSRFRGCRCSQFASLERSLEDFVPCLRSVTNKPL